MFNGIITPIVTPFIDDEKQEINYDATKKLIDHLIHHGINGIFPLGSNGEFHMLSMQERITFSNFVIDYVNHRVPVYVGTGACSTKEAIQLSQVTQNNGADALSVITPYFVKLDDNSIYNYYSAIAEAVEIPIILYNIPANTQNNISPAIFKKLTENYSNIVGIKDSSGNLDIINAYLKITNANNKLHFLIGSDSKISYAYQHGADGAIAGTSNLIVDTVVSLDKALRENRTTEAEFLQKELNPLREVMHKAPVPSVLKRAVTLAKIANAGVARSPEINVKDTLDSEIKNMLVHYKLI